MSDGREIYRLGLHEEHEFGSWVVKRVPGGWLYSFWETVYDDDGDSFEYYRDSTFVPFDREFLNTIEPGPSCRPGGGE